METQFYILPSDGFCFRLSPLSPEAAPGITLDSPRNNTEIFRALVDILRTVYWTVSKILINSK